MTASDKACFTSNERRSPANRHHAEVRFVGEANGQALNSLKTFKVLADPVSTFLAELQPNVPVRNQSCSLGMVKDAYEKLLVLDRFAGARVESDDHCGIRQFMNGVDCPVAVQR